MMIFRRLRLGLHPSCLWL
uniref:Uncharacterized protein n=1 Tax=Arundo donax TaxID=35708 RepID=A0A0A8XQT7_ARUDO